MSSPSTSDVHAPQREHGHPGLALDGVGRSFGAVHAVKDVTLRFVAGERHAVLGPNGAGKTTLFNLITGDLLPSAGQIALGGTDVTTLKPHIRVRQGLRRTYQQSQLFETMSVADNLFLALRGVARGHLTLIPTSGDQVLRDQAADIAEKVNLLDAFDYPVNVLSYGQQRQLEIGMALVGDPQVVLFDEPAAGLSPAERGSLVDLIEALPRTLTIGLVEHDLDIALRLSDRVTIMQDGQVMVTGTPDDIAADPVVQRIYLGAQHG